jgi:hypothetical protein
MASDQAFSIFWNSRTWGPTSAVTLVGTGAGWDGELWEKTVQEEIRRTEKQAVL